MQLRDVMTRRVEVVGPDATIQEAARRMRDLDVGPIPVCDGDRLQGMITDRDIAIRAVAEGKDPTRTRVTEVMSPDVVYCFEDQDVAEASRVMQEQQIRRLIILNRDKRLVGIVSLGDLATEPGAEDEASEALEGISEPAAPRTQVL